MTEDALKARKVEEFLDKCEDRRKAHARDHGHSDFLPQSIEEFAYTLVEGGSVQALGVATEARCAIQQRALEARKDSKEWTTGVPSLGASADEVIQAQWRRLAGIMRVCLVYIPDTSNSKIGDGGARMLDGTLLNRYIEDALKKHFHWSDSEPKGNWGKSKAVFQDPVPGGIRKRGGRDVEFEVDSGSLLLGRGHNDHVFEDIKGLSPGRQWNYFWVVFDVLDSSTGGTNDLLTYVYRKLCGDGKGRQAPKSMKPNGLMKAGVYGLEGVVIARDWPPEADITAPVLTVKTTGGPRDICWGGDIWLAWLLTLYQRAAAEELASSVSKVGVALIAQKAGLKEASENIENDPSSDKKCAKTIGVKIRDLSSAFLNKEKRLELTDEMIKNDTLTILKRYWEDVIALETKWMYREVSRNSDVDIAYQHFQKCYDIEAMWDDVREQTELIARSAEMEHERTVSKTQTYGGIFFGSAIFLAGFFGMNVFGEKGLPLPEGVEPKSLAAEVTLLVGTIAALAWVWYWKSTSPRRIAALFRCQPVLVRLGLGMVLVALWLITPTVRSLLCSCGLPICIAYFDFAIELVGGERSKAFFEGLKDSLQPPS